MKKCFELDTLAFPIKLERYEDGTFCVTYGKEVSKGLRYIQAAHELGECIMHALQCDGELED